MTGGIVPAYAVLAANIFAASAAFNALRGASKVDQLAESLDNVGIAAGRNLPLLAQSLVEVTGYAISTEKALRATALATSSGFSQQQLLDLGTVAKGASIALGRDLSDALDRLVRGTAKLEPEILDELGIFIRIDDVVRDYAGSLGIARDEVTDFARRQAFLNEATRKGLEAFQDVADSVDANPYDKLAATAANLTKDFLTLLNKAIIPLFEYLSSNTSAIIGVIVLLGSTVAKSLVGAFYQDF